VSELDKVEGEKEPVKGLSLAWRPLVLPLLLVALVGGAFVVKSQPSLPAFLRSESAEQTLARAINEQNAGALDAAIPLYEKVIQRQPTNLPAHYNLGLIYSGRGEWAKAQAEFEAALRTDPKYIDALINLGIAQYRQRRFEAAAQAFRQAVAVAPKNFQALFDLGITLVAMGQPEEALRWLMVAQAEQPDLANVNYYRGLAYQQLKKLPEAERELQQELVRNARHVDAYAALAEVYAAQGRPRQAEETRAKAAELNPALKK
jgi:tetratricopeptide (TPR) repeat protein